MRLCLGDGVRTRMLPVETVFSVLVLAGDWLVQGVPPGTGTAVNELWCKCWRPCRVQSPRTRNGGEQKIQFARIAPI